MSGSLEGKKEALVERETQVQRAQAKCHYVGAASLKILERLRQRGFKQVFDALDDNKVKRSPNLDVLWGCMLCHFRHLGKTSLLGLRSHASLRHHPNLMP